MLEAIDAGVPTGFQKLAAPVDREIAAEAMGMERPDSVKETWLTNALWQLGTLGGGNHFLEVQRDEAGPVFVMLHSGSRSLGKTICDEFHKRALAENLALARGACPTGSWRTCPSARTTTPATGRR